MFFCDPTGLFVYGDIGIMPTRISPLEALTLTVVLLNMRKGWRFFSELGRFKFTYAILVLMIGANALRGIVVGGVTAVNSSRAELALLLIPVLPAILATDMQVRKIVKVAVVAILLNLAAELVLQFNILPRDVVRWDGLRVDVPLYDSPVMCASFVLLGILVYRIINGRISLKWYALALLLLISCVMALTRAVWLGLAVASVLLTVRLFDWRTFRRFLPPVLFLGLLGLFMVQNYSSLFGFREEYAVVAAKSETIFDVSRDGDLLFRVLTGLAVLEEVASSTTSFLFGVAHGTSFVYTDIWGKTGAVIIHNAYLVALIHAGLIGLIALLLLLWWAFRYLRVLGTQEIGWRKGLAWTLYACIAAMSANMLFNPNIAERQYIFSFLLALTLVLCRDLLSEPTRGEQTTENIKP